MKHDDRIRREVLEELRWEPAVDASAVEVHVREGVVALLGRVESYAEKRIIEQAAKRVSGVIAVANELAVALPVAVRYDDAEVAEAATRALRWNTRIPHDRIRVTVSDGWLTLEGDVDWYYQVEAAVEAVQDLEGVVGITNKLVVRPQVLPSRVKEQIETAFRRNAEIDAKYIDVEVNGGKVILQGTVRSWTEREDAERAAWKAPGVTQVENHLEVKEFALE